MRMYFNIGCSWLACGVHLRCPRCPLPSAARGGAIGSAGHFGGRAGDPDCQASAGARGRKCWMDQEPLCAPHFRVAAYKRDRQSQNHGSKRQCTITAFANVLDPIFELRAGGVERALGTYSYVAIRCARCGFVHRWSTTADEKLRNSAQALIRDRRSQLVTGKRHSKKSTAY